MRQCTRFPVPHLSDRRWPLACPWVCPTGAIVTGFEGYHQERPRLPRRPGCWVRANLNPKQISAGRLEIYEGKRTQDVRPVGAIVQLKLWRGRAFNQKSVDKISTPAPSVNIDWCKRFSYNLEGSNKRSARTGGLGTPSLG